MLATILSSLTKIMIGAYPYWRHSTPSTTQRVYFANHSSHLDTLAIWSALGFELRKITRPVAAKDYWGKGGIKGIIAHQALNVVLIERSGSGEDDPLKPLYEALDQGDSLIIFPEGTRRYEAIPAPFKSGLFHLSRKYPNVEYVPVYLDNTRRSLPKGVFVPLPVTCTVTFGAPLNIDLNESKESFLSRAREAVINLSKPESLLGQQDEEDVIEVQNHAQIEELNATAEEITDQARTNIVESPADGESNIVLNSNVLSPEVAHTVKEESDQEGSLEHLLNKGIAIIKGKEHAEMLEDSQLSSQTDKSTEKENV